MNNLKLKAKMLVLLLLPVFVILMAVSGISYYYAYGSLDSQIKRTLTFMTDSNSNEIETWLASNEAIVNNVADIITIGTTEPELRRILEQLKKSNPDVINISIGYPDKKMIDALNTIYAKDFDPTSRDWYKKAIAVQGLAYSDPYENIALKKMSLSISRAIRVNGQVIAVVNAPLDLDKLKAIGSKIKAGQTGYGFVLGKKGEYLYHPTLKVTDSILTLQNGTFKQDGELFLSGNPTLRSFSFNGAEKIFASQPIGNTGWALVISVPRDEVFEGVTTLGKVVVVASFIGLILLSFIIWLVANSIVKPVQNLSHSAEKIAKGDLSIQLDVMERSDEIGALSSSFNNMILQLRNIVKQVAHSSSQMAASSEELTASAEQSSQAAEQVANIISIVAAGTEKQTKSVDETSVIIKQMSTNIQQVSANVDSVSSTYHKTSIAANEGSLAAEDTMRQMTNIEQTVLYSASVVDKLGDRSKQIGVIVDTISGIAGQTNLLALNAAIEAARAGEQGRGFAVVAEEVRKLAEQSQEAAKRIADLITEIQDDTTKAVLAMNNGTREVAKGTAVVATASQAFEHISVLVNQTSSQIGQISTAVQQIANGSQLIVSSIHEVDQVSKDAAAHTQSVSAATQEQLASTEEIAVASRSLAELAEELQSAVNIFKI